MKRLIALVLVLAVLLPLCGIKGKAASDETVNYIEKQVRAYAASINQADAASNAAMELAVHGMTQTAGSLCWGKMIN
jgi:hypothetical protein